MSQAMFDRLRELVRDVPDFPQQGVMFKDITPVLADHGALHFVVEQLAAPFRDAHVDAVFGIESRGFILGAPLALTLGAAFVPVRKPGKLPAVTVGVDYDLEYGSDRVEVHKDAVHEGARVLLCDDVIATGGTAAATIGLIDRIGATCVGAAFLMELTFLEGAKKLGATEQHVLLRY